MLETNQVITAARLATAITIMTGTAAVAAVPAVAAAASAERCGRAVVNASTKIVRADARALSRCALAVFEQASTEEAEENCSPLRTAGLRLDRLDARARQRIERRCDPQRPPWLPTRCWGPGPARGEALHDAAAIGRCITTSAHCAALATLDMTFEDPIAALERQSPSNLRYELGGVAGNNFAACLSPDGAATTTTLSDSTTTTLPAGGPPRLVISEIMANPAAQSDAVGEYFEVLNAGRSAVDLAGLVVADLGSDSFTVDGPLVVAAGGRVVFGKSATAAGAIVDYVYGSRMSLTNSTDEIVLTLASEVIDTLAYDDTFPAAAGRAIELVGATTAAANDDPLSWCLSDSPLGDGDFGTPGAAAGACAP